jgi:hypothetical protein
VLAQWYVDFAVQTKNHWLIQHIDNLTTVVEHCKDPSGVVQPYPPSPPLNLPGSPLYFEAWWVDGSGQIQIPRSLNTPPAVATPSPMGDDQWQFASESQYPTHGTLERHADVWVVPTLPSEFHFDYVPAAEELPSALLAPLGLGAPIAHRSAVVEWDFCTPPIVANIRVTR